MRLLLLVALASLLLGAASSQKQTLVIVGNTFQVEMDEGKDKDREPRYILKKQYIVTVQCSMSATDNSVLVEPAIAWHRFGSNGTALDSRYLDSSKLSADKKNFTSELQMRRLNNEDIINYTCTGSTKDAAAKVTAVTQVLSRPLVTFSVDHGYKVTDVSVWPGESVRVHCVVEGNPTGNAEWFKEDDKVFLSLGNSSWLNLTDLDYERDRGFISCRSRNIYGENTAKIFLRVKHPQAYLLPLLIIIGELVVIGVIIAGYEFYMHRKRSRANQAYNSSQPAADAYKTD